MLKIKHKIWKNDNGWFVGENIDQLVGPMPSKASAIEFRDNLNKETNIVEIDEIILFPTENKSDKE